MTLRLPRVLIWDVDGVIVSVGDSYRRAIVDTVQCYFSDLIGLNLDKRMVGIDDTQRFKLAGKFNNDWEVTYAIILSYLTKMIDKQDLNRIGLELPDRSFRQRMIKLQNLGRNYNGSRMKLDLDDLTKRIKEKGGGLEKTKEVLHEKFGQNLEIALKFLFEEMIKNIFQELYLGGDLYREKYRRYTDFIFASGFIRDEKPIVKKETIDKLSDRYILGIATGRERFEVKYTLKKHRIDKFFPAEFIVTSEDVSVPKPAPNQLLECMRRIRKRYGFTREEKAAYIGDSVDDIIAAKQAEFYSIGCLSSTGNEEQKEVLKKEFERLGCDLILNDANELLDYTDG